MRTLFCNAQCWSAGKEIFDGILIENGIIIATGETALAASHDERIDLDGAFVIPAFLDGHAHPIFGGREAAGPKINGLTSLEEILAGRWQSGSIGFGVQRRVRRTGSGHHLDSSVRRSQSSCSAECQSAPGLHQHSAGFVSRRRCKSCRERPLCPVRRS